MPDWDPEANDLFLQALEIPAPGDRQRFLEEACAGKPDLRARVDGLLRAGAEAGSFLERPLEPPELTGAHVPSSADDPAVSLASPGTTIGRYKLVEVIGEGGMGTVWLAEQTEPVRRKVALKLVKPGMDSKQVLARFEAERQALALMDHPNIAKVLDGGATADGRPYFVMELVKGVPITKYCDDHRMPPRQRLELFLAVCQAVQHAHQKGIIHRDIKPSNVLVAPYDGRPVPKVIDFGIAKATGQPLTEKTLFTGLGAVVGTPEYMSPEQAELNNQDIDTRSDIYSLGVLLYELLTGSTPITRKRLKAAALLEVLRLVREEEAQKPSTRLLDSKDSLPSISAQRQTEPAKLTKLVRGELDWIVMKALEKDRTRRYESANGFALDLQRYLADEAVQACPPTAAYRLRKFARRNKGPVLAVSAIGLLMATAIGGTTVGLLRALAAEQKTRTERDQKETALQRVIVERDQKELARREAATERDQKEEARRQVRQALDTLTDAVVDDLLGQQVQLTDQHRAFLRKVLAQHAAFAEAGVDDPQARRSRAEGYARVARIRQLLGEHTDAIAAYGDAITFWKQLAADFPEQPDFRYNTAVCLGNLGVVLRNANQFRDAESVFGDAQILLERLKADFPQRPAFAQLLAKNHVDTGIFLSDNTSRLKDAERHYDDAVALYQPLVDAFPNDPGFREGLAFSHNNRAILLDRTGRIELAETAYRTALAIREKLVVDFPKRLDFAQSLALSHNNLGVLLRATRRPEEAEKQYRAALALRMKLAAQFPSRPDFQDDLAQSHGNLGNLLLSGQQWKDAEEQYRAAVAIHKQLVFAFPQRPDFRNELARWHRNLGNLLSDTGRFPQATDAYSEALTIQKQLVAEFQDVSDYRSALATTLGNQARLCNRRGKFAEAAALLESARPHHEFALRTNPRDPVNRRFYGNDLWTLSNCYTALGDHARLATTAEDLARYSQDPSRTYDAACFLCKCILLVEKDDQTDKDKRPELIRRYGDHAIVQLRQALERGWTGGALIMKRDSFLNPIRARDDFKKLLAEWEEKTKK